MYVHVLARLPCSAPPHPNADPAVGATLKDLGPFRRAGLLLLPLFLPLCPPSLCSRVPSRARPPSLPLSLRPPARLPARLPARPLAHLEAGAAEEAVLHLRRRCLSHFSPRKRCRGALKTADSAHAPTHTPAPRPPAQFAQASVGEKPSRGVPLRRRFRPQAEDSRGKLDWARPH